VVTPLQSSSGRTSTRPTRPGTMQFESHRALPTAVIISDSSVGPGCVSRKPGQLFVGGPTNILGKPGRCR